MPPTYLVITIDKKHIVPRAVSVYVECKKDKLHHNGHICFNWLADILHFCSLSRFFFIQHMLSQNTFHIVGISKYSVCLFVFIRLAAHRIIHLETIHLFFQQRAEYVLKWEMRDAFATEQEGRLRFVVHLGIQNNKITSLPLCYGRETFLC